MKFGIPEPIVLGRLGWTVGLSLACFPLLPLPGLIPPCAAAQERPAFEVHAAPFLAKHCTHCHNAAKRKGDLVLDRHGDGAAAAADPGTWEKVLGRVEAGEMPPESRPRPERSEVEPFLAWVRSILESSMIVYGSAIGDGNRHNHDDLPILLVGKGGGTIETGRHVRYRQNTPLNNLYLSLLDRMEAPAESLGDGTGKLPWLAEETRLF